MLVWVVCWCHLGYGCRFLLVLMMEIIASNNCIPGCDIQGGGWGAGDSSYSSWWDDRPTRAAARRRYHQRGVLLFSFLFVFCFP